MSGISKRLFIALSNFRGKPSQLEDALFQLASVIDSTSKHHFPGETSSKKRFSAYLDSVATDLFTIATSGRITLVDCTFLGPKGDPLSFGEIIYGIRCSSYHDPNEVDNYIYWGDDNQIGLKDGKFIVNQRLLHAMFLILFSDEANKDHIDTDLFDEQHFFTWNVENYPFKDFIGDRDTLFDVLDLNMAKNL